MASGNRGTQDPIGDATVSSETNMDDEKTPNTGTEIHREKPPTQDNQTHHEKTPTKDADIHHEKTPTESTDNGNRPPPKSLEINTDVVLNVLPELCEFAPLDFILQQLPRKAQRAQRALPAVTVELTCLDVNKDFIVLGANFSMVFVYDRSENTIVKLRCEDRSCRITCVKLLTRIDHQIAVGTSNGQVEVYLLPAKRPGQVIKELKKFVIDGGHRSNVTCAEWSANGMKLFTGDSVGNVVYSDVDFYENKCNSELIHKEDMPIVQLNYAHKILIISTYSRTVLCYTDENYRLQQVGQQPRKSKGYFGGHFVPTLCKARDATLCATRPGLRMWHATVNGAVQETLKFKHLLSAQHQTIMLLPSTRPPVCSNVTDLQFGPVLFFGESYVLTWSHNLLAVLDIDGPSGARVVASSLGDLGSIISVATFGEEIYVLRRGPDRQLIRIAMDPEVFQEKEHLTLSEAEQLLNLPGPADKLHVGGSNSNSPITQRKTSFKQGLSVMRTLFSKAKEEIVDTTSKLMVPKFGKHDLAESQSAGSSRRNSQDNVPISAGETPDATLSPEVLAAQFAARADSSKEHVPHESPESDSKPVTHPEIQAKPSEETSETPRETASDQATDRSSERMAPADCALAEEPPTVTLNEEKLLKIGQESFDDILFEPVKLSKKKKKKSHKASKKESAERSSTPSPTPDGQNSPRASDTHRNRSESTKSDDTSLRSENYKSENRSIRSDSSSSDSKHARSESIGRAGSQDPSNARSDCNRRDGWSPRSERVNGANSSVYHQHPDRLEIHNAKTERSASMNGESGSTRSESLNSAGGSDRSDTREKVPGHTEVMECTDVGRVPAGNVLLGGVISSSVDNVATRTSTPAANSMLNPCLIELPGTLRSWESPPGIAEKLRPGHGKRDKSTDSIHTLRSDIDSLKLDLKTTVPSEAFEQPLQFQNNGEALSPTTKMTNYSPSEDKAVNRKSDSTDEDIYAKYLAATPGSDASSPPGVFAAEESQARVCQDHLQRFMDPEAHDDIDEGTADDIPIPENIQQRFAGSWMQCNTPGYVMQLVVSDKHVWCVDNRDKVYHSLVSNVSIKWNKLKDSAMQIASSPNGNIVWRLHRRSGTAFACAPISPHSPIGTKWYETSKGATHICLDENMAWVIKQNGDIYAHKGISRDLPLTKEERVESNAYVVQIAACRGVVWAVGSNKKVMYRSDVTRTKAEGKKWMDLDDDGVKIRFVSIALDSRNVGWGIDDDGLVWFRTGVTPGTPKGDDKKWWQVPMGEYLMQDPNALKMLLNIAGTNATVDRMTTWLKRQYYRATHIAASAASVWVCGSYHYKSSLHVSKGNLLGSRWESGCPVGLPLSAVWVSVSSTGVYGPSGMIWAALKSGEVFCFPPDTRKPLQVDPPRAGVIFKHLSATSDTMWALQEDGDIYVRKHISERCPQGLSWKELGLDQLGPCRIVHFSCGAEVVWACDNEGMIYLRIGVDIPRDESLPPAWVPVDGRAVGFNAYFVQVFCSVDNRLVWALDNKRAVYVRRGICEGLPVGLEWEVVEGTQAIHLCISSSTVWALCPNGDVACRFGITEKNSIGDYWKKVPGSYTYLSVTQSDDLWTISNEGKLFQRFTKMFQRRGVPQVEQLGSPIGEDDWELL